MNINKHRLLDKPLYAAAGDGIRRTSLLVLLFYGSAFYIADMHLVVYEQDVCVKNTGLAIIRLLAYRIFISIYPILELADTR